MFSRLKIEGLVEELGEMSAVFRFEVLMPFPQENFITSSVLIKQQQVARQMESVEAKPH